MRFWNQYPFFRLIIPFAAGILIAVNFPKPDRLETWQLISLCALLFSSIMITGFFTSYSRSWLSGLFIYLFTFSAGYSLTIGQTEIYQSKHFGKFLRGEQLFVIKISEPPAERAKSVRAFGKVRYLIDSAGSKPLMGKVLLYFEKDSAAQNLKYGDILIVQARIAETEPPGNPHQFDYKKYLANSGIYHQAYIRNDKWQQIDSNKVNPLFNYSYLARDRMLQILERRGLSGDEFAVVSAILLGYDDRMEPELRNLYAGAGALHVLCVSGLHVGIIFLIVSFLLKSFQKTKKLRFVRFVVLLLSIWAYAFITGLAPSVLRAGVMFSLFSWRELAKEKSDSYNIIAASAFILLAIDPYLITKVGFQLSYSAVIGIIALHAPLYKLMVFKNPVADYLWSLSVVSVAAQIGTFPLAIFYFNQFPLYFLLTNIIVIPVVWLIVYTGIATLLFSPIWELLSTIIARILHFQVYLLNLSVEWVNRLPNAKIEGLSLSFPQVIVVYLLMIFLVRFFIKKQGSYAVATLSLALMLTGSFVFQKIQTLRQQDLVIYKVNGYSAMDFTFGDQLLALADTSLLNDTRTMEFNIAANRLNTNVRETIQLVLQPEALRQINLNNLPVKYYSPNFMLAGDTRIVLVDNNLLNYSPEVQLKIDLVVLQKNTNTPISRLMEMFDFEQLVFDTSNDPWKIREWRKYCDERQIPFYDISEKGALVRKL